MTVPKSGPKRPQKVRDKPRISINKLAEYLVASPRRRRSIIKEQKFPKDFQVIWYHPAEQAILLFLRGACTEPSLAARGRAIQLQTPANDNDATKLKNNAEAIAAFLRGYRLLNLDGLAAAAAPKVAPKFEFNGVEVSVRPELLLSGVYRSKPAAGAIKLYFSKDTPLTEASGEYVSTLVHHHLDILLKKPPSRRHCQVLDVFGQAAFVAPTSTTSKMHDVRAACAEIFDRWDGITLV